MSNAAFKVLAIDGGGIKGLFSAQVLAELERARGPVVDHFDLICGTSTGGLIALAIGAGSPCADIVTFYKEWGPKIFSDLTRIKRAWTGLRQIAFGARYNTQVLKEAIRSLVQDKNLGDSKTRLCIPSVDLTDNKPVVFKTRHAGRLSWPNLPMLDVGMATAAAPTFFPTACLSDLPTSSYADGGLFANNPSMIGLIEALRFFVGPKSEHPSHEEVWVLSVASMDSPKAFPRNDKRNLSISDWMNPFRGAPLLNALMDAQARSTIESMKILARCLPLFTTYYRIEPPRLADAQLRPFKLHNARAAALAELEKHGAIAGRTAASQPEVIRFFQTKIKQPTYY